MTLVEIGHVTRAHGLQGEVKVRLHWEHGETLRAGARFELHRGRDVREVVVSAARKAGRQHIVRFDDVADRDAAELLQGGALMVPRDRLPSLEPGEYYLCDLIGARVEVGGDVIGVVTEVALLPAADALTIELPDGTRAQQVLAEPWIESIDVDSGVVRLTTRDGLI